MKIFTVYSPNSTFIFSKKLLIGQGCGSLGLGGHGGPGGPGGSGGPGDPGGQGGQP